MKTLKDLIQFKFNLSSRVCVKLDGAIAKNDTRMKASWNTMHKGSLTQRLKGHFWFGYSLKMATMERAVKLPFAASRKLNGLFLKK